MESAIPHQDGEFLDLTAQVESFVHTRCPACSKAFVVDRQELRTGEVKFECAGCKSAFAFFYNSDEWIDSATSYLLPILSPDRFKLGAYHFTEKSTAAVTSAKAPVDFKAPPPPTPATPRSPLVEEGRGGAGAKTNSASLVIPSSLLRKEWIVCPKCDTPNPALGQECRSCGVVLNKAKSQDEDLVEGEILLTGRRELAEMWSAIVQSYDVESAHEKFVLRCHELNCLPFASQKYARILSANGSDELAKKMRKRIVALASTKAHVSPLPRRLPFQVRMPAINSLIIILGTIVMMMGLILPGLKNLTGVGVSVLALAFGLRWYLRTN